MDYIWARSSLLATFFCLLAFYCYLMVTYEFPARGDMPPVKLIWYDGGLRPPRPEELDAGALMGANGHLFIGDNRGRSYPTAEVMR